MFLSPFICKKTNEESFHGGGVGFGEGMGTVNPVVHHHQHAAIGRFGIGCHGDRIVKIQRTVGTHGCSGAHGPGYDDRFFAFNRQVQKVGFVRLQNVAIIIYQSPETKGRPPVNPADFMIYLIFL